MGDAIFCPYLDVNTNPHCIIKCFATKKKSEADKYHETETCCGIEQIEMEMPEMECTEAMRFPEAKKSPVMPETKYPDDKRSPVVKQSQRAMFNPRPEGGFHWQE